MSRLKSELPRFLVVGVTTVAVDYVSYQLLLAVGIALAPAKAGGFIAGTVFAYFANKTWTFSHRGNHRAAFIFAVLYGVTLGVNVATNSLVVGMLRDTSFALSAGFLAATAVSATLNFLGMKFLVFRREAA